MYVLKNKRSSETRCQNGDTEIRLLYNISKNCGHQAGTSNFQMEISFFVMEVLGLQMGFGHIQKKIVYENIHRYANANQDRIAISRHVCSSRARKLAKKISS